MKNRPSPLRLISLVAFAIALVAIPRAHAATNLLSVYIGAGYGHAAIRARDAGLVSAVPGSGLGSFDLGHSAYQITAGVRGLELLGAEIDYFDLGSGGALPSWTGEGSLTNAHVSQKGEAAFAVLYLPVPIIDVYLKAGVARLRTDLYASATIPACSPGLACPLVCTVNGCPPPLAVNGSRESTETTFAGGAGVQWKLGDWAIRGEYERFTALGEHPSLVTLGLTWSFL